MQRFFQCVFSFGIRMNASEEFEAITRQRVTWPDYVIHVHVHVIRKVVSMPCKQLSRR